MNVESAKMQSGCVGCGLHCEVNGTDSLMTTSWKTLWMTVSSISALKTDPFLKR